MYNFDEIYNRSNYDAIRTIPQKDIHKECLSLWIADMDLPVASEIQDALIERMKFPNFGYTQRTARYYNAISNWMLKRHQWEIENNWIATTPGIIPAMAFAIQSFVKKGGKVLIQPPLYPPFAKMIQSNGGTIVTSPLVLNDDQYEIDFEDFEQKAKDPDTQMFFLCNPHNPVGRVWTKEELTKLAEICLKHDVLIFSDDVHHDIVYSGFHYTPIASLSPEVSNITITATTPGKTFNITGFKVGNIIIENRTLREAYQARVESMWCQHLDISAIEATIAAYTHGEPWLEEVLKYLEGNNDFIDQFIADRLPQLRTYRQEGTYLKWIDFNQLELRQENLEDLMLVEAKLWMNEGYTFGEGGAGFERLNFASPRTVIQNALERIEHAVKRL